MWHVIIMRLQRGGRHGVWLCADVVCYNRSVLLRNGCDASQIGCRFILVVCIHMHFEF